MVSSGWSRRRGRAHPATRWGRRQPRGVGEREGRAPLGGHQPYRVVSAGVERELATVRRPARAKLIPRVVGERYGLATAKGQLVEIRIPPEVAVVRQPLPVRRHVVVLDYLAAARHRDAVPDGAGTGAPEWVRPDVLAQREFGIGEPVGRDGIGDRVRVGYPRDGTQLSASSVVPDLDDVHAAGAVAVRHEHQVPRIEPDRADVETVLRRHRPRLTAIGVHDPDGGWVHVAARPPPRIATHEGNALAVRRPLQREQPTHHRLHGDPAHPGVTRRGGEDRVTDDERHARAVG
jgi:hypothetical protein